MGIVISVVLGIVFCIVYYVGGNKIFGGKGELIFKGFNCLIAAALILWLSFAMLKFLVSRKPPPSFGGMSSLLALPDMFWGRSCAHVATG